jgi:hypothetical protein
MAFHPPQCSGEEVDGIQNPAVQEGAKMVGASVAAVGSVREALLRTGLASLRDLQVEEGAETVIVTGKVPTFYCKQVAQETVVSAAGPRRVVIRISVAPSGSASSALNEP